MGGATHILQCTLSSTTIHIWPDTVVLGFLVLFPHCTRLYTFLSQSLISEVFLGRLTVPDTSYLRGFEVFCSFPTQVSMKVHQDICSATATLLRTTCTDSGEGFGLISDDVEKFFQILEQETQFVKDDS